MQTPASAYPYNSPAFTTTASTTNHSHGPTLNPVLEPLLIPAVAVVFHPSVYKRGGHEKTSNFGVFGVYKASHSRSRIWAFWTPFLTIQTPFEHTSGHPFCAILDIDTFD